MNAILGLTHLLKDSFIKKEERETLDLIQRSSLNLLNIINDILDLSKIEAGMFRLEKIDYQPIEVVDLVFKLLEGKAEEKGIKLIKDISPELPQFVVGDPHRLNQILVNLIGNAIKFTAHGSVSLKLNHKQIDDAELKLEFQVIDTGIGIPEDKLETIFESFSQAEEGTSRKFGGTGLGLTISRKLVNIHGGTLGVSSKLGQGSNFSFDLSCKRSDKAQSQQETTPNKSPFSLTELTGFKVLLVDDNKVNRLVGKKTLSRWKMVTEMAVDGQDAVEKALENQYDLILMDLQMPIMNGYEASSTIRNDENNPNQHTPIIALTANVMDNVLKDAAEAGIQTVVTKPFDPGNLYRVMQSYLIPATTPSS
ncbi:MAG: ATP-binding protein, partial [Bacteroidota bacterium]